MGKKHASQYANFGSLLIIFKIQGFDLVFLARQFYIMIIVL